MKTIRGFRFSVNAICISLCIYAGCSGSDDAEKVDCSISDLEAEAVGDDPTDCASNDGSITIEVTGGKTPYRFAINTGSFGSSAVFNNLGPGDYLLRVKDKNGCEVATNLSLEMPGLDPLLLNTNLTADTQCVGNNGSVEMMADGGTPPYQYKLDNGAFDDESLFNGLAPGNYFVAVKDATNCVFTKSVTIDKGDSGTTLSLNVRPIIQANCAITNCHNGSQSPDLRMAVNVIAHAQTIKSVTQNGSMPKEGNITAAQKAIIACWVDEGAKNN